MPIRSALLAMSVVLSAQSIPVPATTSATTNAAVTEITIEDAR